MIISKEQYYSIFLEGKDASGVQAKIRGIKRENTAIKAGLEHPEKQKIRLQTKDAKDFISSNRQYMAMAIELLSDMGVVYEPSKADKRINALQEELQYVYKVVLERCLDDGRVQQATLDVTGETVSLTTGEAIRENYLTKAELVEKLRNLYPGEWKRRYGDSTVLNGEQWTLTIRLSSRGRCLKYVGNNAFPYNYDELLEVFGLA